MTTGDHTEGATPVNCCARTDEHTHEIRIRSTIDPGDRKAACLLDWGLAIQALITPDTALATARDLAAAAAGAETDVALIQALREDINADDDVIAGLLGSVRRRRPLAAAPAALRISAVAGYRTGKPYVHVARGSMKPELDPGEAREMALHWTEVAVAAQIDARLRYALSDLEQLTPGDVEEIFTRLQDLQR